MSKKNVTHTQITTPIKTLITQYPVLAVTGPRQSGKTTMIKNTFPSYTYVSLENPDIREFARQDPNNFLKTYPAPVIFDEAQTVPELFSYIQTAVDAVQQPGQYILSGSQNFLLSTAIAQSLSGRVAMCKRLPFSVQELKAHNGLPALNEFLYRGAYPPIYDRQIPPNQMVRRLCRNLY